MNEEKAIIKVVGVGGYGCAAIELMMHDGMEGVELICVDTDIESLKQSSVNTKLQISANLGSGDEMNVPINDALAERNHIIDVLHGADMVFIIAGMGGNTGTGVACVIAELATYLKIFTVAVVTTPFESERERMRIAKDGLSELVRHVDSLIVLPNEKLNKMLGEQFTMRDAFLHVQSLLKIAVSSIAYTIIKPSLIGVDLADVYSVMAKTGMGAMGFSTTTGVNRARRAVERALKCPLLENVNLKEGYGIFINITSGGPLAMSEVSEALDIIHTVSDLIIASTTIDVDMGESLRVTIIATGLGNLVEPEKKLVT